MRLFIGSFLLAALSVVSAESRLTTLVVDLSPEETLVLHQKEDSRIKIDGYLDETVWEYLPAYDELFEEIDLEDLVENKGILYILSLIHI